MRSYLLRFSFLRFALWLRPLGQASVGQLFRAISTHATTEVTCAAREHNGAVDNGSEFISKVLDQWAYENEVTLDFSRPGKPTDNAFIESFNGSFRDECLNVNWFLLLEDAQEKIKAFKDDYNGFRPHSSLRGLTPNQVLERHLPNPKFSTLAWY